MVYRLLFNVGLEDVFIPVKLTRSPHVTSCDPAHEDFNLNLIYSSNGKDDRLEQTLASRALYSTYWWFVVRNILKIRPLYLSSLQALQDSFYEFSPNYSNVVGGK
jgi:hypothetical protein